MRTMILLAALTVSSCATAQPFINAGKACVDEANSATANKIIPDVNAAISCAISSKEDLPQCAVDSLETLGRQWGSAALICALDKIANGVSADPNDTAAPVRRNRAKAALQRTRVSWRATDGRRSLALMPPGFGPGTGGG